jgi:aconitate hydratase
MIPADKDGSREEGGVTLFHAGHNTPDKARS